MTNRNPCPPIRGRGRLRIRRPSDETLRQLLRAASVAVQALPPRWRATGAAAVLLLAALLGVTVTAVQDLEYPAYLATAVLDPDPECLAAIPDNPGLVCRTRDVNLAVWPDGRREELPVSYDAQGHARPPSYTPRVRGPLGPLAQPMVASMGWPVEGFARAVLGRQRPLRYCAREARAFDEAVAAEMVRATLDKVDGLVDVLPSEERCDDPDLTLSADARDVCGEGALGCAAVRHDGRRYFVNVSVDGPSIGPGRVYPLVAAYATNLHEVGHAFDMAHAGRYGGEPGNHAHPSDLDAICMGAGTAYSCSNPTGRPAAEDWYADEAGRTLRFGGRLRGQEPPPPPSPSPPPPSPMPSRRPTPSPAPSAPPLAGDPPQPWEGPPPAGTPERAWWDSGFNGAWCTYGPDPWNVGCHP